MYVNVFTLGILTFDQRCIYDCALWRIVSYISLEDLTNSCFPEYIHNNMVEDFEEANIIL